MIRRLAIVLLVCGGLGYFLQREQARGTYDDWERSLVGWLERGMDRPVEPPPVVLVELKRGDLPFEAWPPAPLDYALVLENLVRRQPRQVVVQPLLSWAGVDLLDAATLAERIALLPRGVLACTLHQWMGGSLDREPFEGGAVDAVSGEAIPEDGSPAAATPREELPLPVLPGASGDLTKVVEFHSLGLAPDEAVRGGKPMGFTRIDFGEGIRVEEGSVRVPMVARRGNELVPSLVLQALMSWQSSGAGEVVMQLGRRVMIGPSMEVPVDRAGRQVLLPRLAAPVRRVDAGVLLLDLERDHQLMAERAVEVEVLQSMEGALVVLGESGDGVARFPVAGTEDGGWTEAEAVARALVAAMAGWHPREIPSRWQWTVWAVVVAMGTLLLRCPRKWWPVFAVGGAAVLALAITLAFLLRQWWLPPLPPLALWSAAAVVALLLPIPPSAVPPTGAVTPTSARRTEVAENEAAKNEAAKNEGIGTDDLGNDDSGPSAAGRPEDPLGAKPEAAGDRLDTRAANAPKAQAGDKPNGLAATEADEATALASQLAPDPDIGDPVEGTDRPGR